MIAELGETQMQIGIDSFAAAYDDASLAVSASDRLRNLVEQIEFADQVGLDVFGIGEHHRRDYLDSAPVVILGAAAARTHRIRLTSAVTVLSSADPVRVFQNFATLDLLSQGRAEMVVGRGSFIDSFPLFGFKLEDYDSLFGREARPAPKDPRERARPLVRQTSGGPNRSGCLPETGAESFSDMARSWRDSTIVRSRGAWSSFNGRNHRR